MFSDGAARLAGLAGAVLGWRPEEFWRATPAELATVLSMLVGERPTMAADDLGRLMEQFPDQPSSRTCSGIPCRSTVAAKQMDPGASPG